MPVARWSAGGGGGGGGGGGASLLSRGGGGGREAKVLLPKPGEVRRQDHAAAGAGPAVHVETGVVAREVWIARVAEDALHEIEVGHQTAGHEEPHLAPLFWRHLRHRGADQRPQQQRDHRLHPLGTTPTA